MIRPRWSARPGQGGILNREKTDQRLGDIIREMLAGPDLTGAACTTTDPDLWYPEKGGGRVALTARTLCGGGLINGKRVPQCPVRAACLSRALDSDDHFTHWGIWAGYTAKQIRRMRKLRDALRRAACPPRDQAA
jgi:hypothetical protein